MTAMFSYVNRVDAAVLTSSEASNLPVTNLADPRLQKLFRSQAISFNFGADFGANVSIRLLALFGATLSATDTIRHRLSTVSLGAGDVLDTTALAGGVVAGYGQHLSIQAAALTARYWQCDIVATSRASLGYVDIGRALAGDVWTPSIGFATGWRERWEDQSEVKRSRRSGTVFVSEADPYRILNVMFDALSEADRINAMEMDRIAGIKKQILFIPNDSDDPPKQAILGKQTTVEPIIQADDSLPAHYSKAYELQQDL